MVCTIFVFWCIFQYAAAFLNPFASAQTSWIEYVRVYAQFQILLHACEDAEVSPVQPQCLNPRTGLILKGGLRQQCFLVWCALVIGFGMDSSAKEFAVVVTHSLLYMKECRLAVAYNLWIDVREYSAKVHTGAIAL